MGGIVTCTVTTSPKDEVVWKFPNFDGSLGGTPNQIYGFIQQNYVFHRGVVDFSSQHGCDTAPLGPAFSSDPIQLVDGGSKSGFFRDSQLRLFDRLTASFQVHGLKVV